MRSITRQGIYRQVIAYLFMLPALVLLTIFLFIPIVKVFQLSVSNVNIIGMMMEYIGLANYKRLLVDHAFWTCLSNTLLYTLMTVPGLTILAFLLALLVNTTVRGVKVFRVIYYIPVVTSMVIAGVVWKWMFQTDGLLNSLLELFHLGPVPWLTSTSMAMLSVSLMTIWKSTGYYMVIYLAGLQSIDSSLYEAATVDGARKWQQVVKITMPLMRPFALVVATIGTINAFRIFGEVFVLTQGGPAGSTNVLAVYVYNLAFKQLDLGYASTVAVALLLITMLLSILNFKFFSGGASSNV